MTLAPLHVVLAERGVRRLDGQRAAVRHRIARIDGEVHDDLFQLSGVGSYAGEIRREPDDDVDVLTDQARDHASHLGQHAVQVEDGRLDDLLPAEREQLSRQRRGARAGLLNLDDVRQPRIAGVGISEEHFAVAEDDGEQVVEVVRHGARERPMASIFWA